MTDFISLLIWFIKISCIIGIVKDHVRISKSVFSVADKFSSASELLSTFCSVLSSVSLAASSSLSLSDEPESSPF